MSTNCIVAEPIDGDVKNFRGRYCHWDGDAWMALQLSKIVARDGIQIARQTLLHDHWYWSSIDQSMDAERFTQLGYDDAMKMVAGYGAADHPTARGVVDSEWTTPNDWPVGWPEWLHVLGDDVLTSVPVRATNGGQSFVPQWDRATTTKYGDHPTLEY